MSSTCVPVDFRIIESANVHHVNLRDKAVVMKPLYVLFELLLLFIHDAALRPHYHPTTTPRLL